MKTINFSWGGNIGFRMGRYHYNAMIFTISNVPEDIENEINNELSDAMEYKNHSELCMDYFERRKLVMNRIKNICEKYNLIFDETKYEMSVHSSMF